MDVGTPCSGPSSSPRITAASASRAISSAMSGTTVRKALSVGLSRSMRSSASSATSTGDTSFEAISSRTRCAGIHVSSSFVGISASCHRRLG